MLGQSSGTAFWGFSPGIIGIAWLPALLGEARRAEPVDGLLAGVDGPSRMKLYGASAGMAAVLGAVLVEDASLVSGGRPATMGALSFLLTKAMVGVLILAIFLACFRCVSVLARGRSPVLTSVVGTAVFALGGAALAALRHVLGDQGRSFVALVALHALGFVLAYLAGLAAIRSLRGSLPKVWSPLDAAACPPTSLREIRA